MLEANLHLERRMTIHPGVEKLSLRVICYTRMQALFKLLLKSTFVFSKEVKHFLNVYNIFNGNVLSKY